MDAGISRELVLKEPELASLRQDLRFKDLVEGRTPVERGQK